VDAPSFLYLVGIEKAVGPAFHRFLANHALGEEIGEGLVGAEDPEIPEDLGVKSRVEEMENGMFDAADVLIDGHPVVKGLPVQSRLLVVGGTAELVKIP